MCGIAGGFENNSDARKMLDKVSAMTDRIQHRGPDFSDVQQFGEVTFGHSRLSIIDTRDVANQPFSDSLKKNALIFNGEIYNYKVLKKELQRKGEHFKTKSDTEVLFQLLRHEGLKCLDRLNGMFAFAWWNTDTQELHLVRDRLGIKPIYYTFQKSGLYFASELRALKPVTDFRFDHKQLNRLLSLQSVPGENTAIEGIQELRPGHLLSIDTSGNYKITQWYDVESVFNQPKNESITPEDIRTQFFKSVKRRLVSDVPIGAFLSGGIDSSAVVAAMAQQSESQVKTYSVGFDDERFDERNYAKLVAQRYETDHTEIMLNNEQVLEMVTDAVSAMDTPSGDAVNTFIVSKVTKQSGLTVALSGLGGDELFSGYPSFKYWQMIKKMRFAGKISSNVRKKILQLIPGQSIQKEKLRKILSGSLTAPELVYRMRQVFTDEMLVKLNIEPLNWLGTYASEINTPQDQLTFSELFLYCQPLLLKDTDQMSMASALEVRVPFLDHEFLKLVMQLPQKKRKFGYRDYAKGFFVDALKKDIPEECYRRSKAGFVLPMQNWIKNELKDFTLDGLHTSENHQLLGEQKLNHLYEQFTSDKPEVSWSRIWLLSVLGHWLHKNKVVL